MGVASKVRKGELGEDCDDCGEFGDSKAFEVWGDGEDCRELENSGLGGKDHFRGGEDGENRKSRGKSKSFEDPATGDDPAAKDDP